MMPCLEKGGVQRGSVGVKKALFGGFLGVAGVEKTEVTGGEQRAERNIVDVVSISAAALQHVQCAAAQREASPAAAVMISSVLFSAADSANVGASQRYHRHPAPQLGGSKAV